MEIKFDIPTNDLEVIQDNIDFLQKHIGFKILDDYFKVQDESLADYEGGATMFDWKEVIIEIQSINNLWALAKLVQRFNLTGKFTL